MISKIRVGMPVHARNYSHRGIITSLQGRSNQIASVLFVNGVSLFYHIDDLTLAKLTPEESAHFQREDHADKYL